MRILTSEITKKDGEEIELKGWVDSRRDHGKIIFVDLRDRKGIVQCVFTPKKEKLYEKAENLRSEWVVKIKGEVSERPDGMKNDDIETGDYEISVNELEVINKAETPPIEVDDDGYEIGEDVRMKYRYLDLRRKRMNKNLKQRHKIIQHFRNYFTNKDFVEVETPVLGKSTPEGARDFLVPSRLHAGQFYALPQSPQQYKQLLMVAGLERYFQIVKCFRDEDMRGDRQTEFTQLDMEMSFTSEEEVLSIMEDAFLSMVKEFFPDKKLKLDDGSIPRMTYSQAMEEYDTDRPDIRDDKEDDDELAFLFVTDFPVFEYKEGDDRWGSMHHPFTKPEVKDKDDLKEKFEDDPSQIKAHQYDLVLNGYEIAGGSIRIHDPELLTAVFKVLGHSDEDIENRFGHLMEAFKYGTPPHGGIAVGLDRVLAILLKEPNIREVIAFPKTGDGRDLMMNAPSDVDKDQLEELNIKVDKEE